MSEPPLRDPGPEAVQRPVEHLAQLRETPPASNAHQIIRRFVLRGELVGLRRIRSSVKQQSTEICLGQRGADGLFGDLENHPQGHAARVRIRSPATVEKHVYKRL